MITGKKWKCKKCSTEYVYTPDEVLWIEQSMYSEKVTKCPKCGHMNIIKYVEGFNQNPNFEQRYYN